MVEARAQSIVILCELSSDNYLVIEFTIICSNATVFTLGMLLLAKCTVSPLLPSSRHIPDISFTWNATNWNEFRAIRPRVLTYVRKRAGLEIAHVYPHKRGMRSGWKLIGPKAYTSIVTH